MQPPNTVAVQFTNAFLCAYLDWSWPTIALVALCVGGFMAHSLVLAMHELSHDLWFATKWKNQWFGYLANSAVGVAVSASFRRYHLEHHSHQGSDRWDADIPTALEGRLFTTTLSKLFFVVFQWAFYAFRPLLVKPKALSLGEVYNWLVVGAFDLCLVHFVGVKALGYLLLSLILGLGPNPVCLVERWGIFLLWFRSRREVKGYGQLPRLFAADLKSSRQAR